MLEVNDGRKQRPQVRLPRLGIADMVISDQLGQNLKWAHEIRNGLLSSNFYNPKIRKKKGTKYSLAFSLFWFHFSLGKQNCVVLSEKKM